MDYPTESDYETELDYVDQDTTNQDEEDDEDSTLKDQDVLQLEDDNESELDDKCATKLEQMQISAEGNEKETSDQEEPTEKRQLRERKTKPGEYKDRHSGKQERTPKDTNSKRKTSTKTAKTGNNERKETPAGQQGSTAEDTNKEIKSLREQINKIKRISKEKETENARLNRTIEEKDEEIRTLKEELKQKDKELIQVKEQLLQILLTERQNTDRDTEHMDTEETQKPTMIIASDSNTGRMLPDIKSQLNDHSITRVTTMTSKDTKAWAEQENEETLNGNTVIIHVGTNDIRHGEKARNILANIRNAAAIVEEKGAICLIMQIPPMYTTSEESRETVKLNAMFEGTLETQLITNTPIEQDRNMIEEDGYHLTRKGTATCAKQIAAYMKQSSQPPERTITSEHQSYTVEVRNTTPPHIETIETTAEIAGRVIGQGASNIKRIKAKSQQSRKATKEFSKLKDPKTTHTKPDKTSAG